MLKEIFADSVNVNIDPVLGVTSGAVLRRPGNAPQPHNITAPPMYLIALGDEYTVGLKKGGMVATGRNNEGQCNVSDWKLF
jgi:hypothetical protein